MDEMCVVIFRNVALASRDVPFLLITDDLDRLGIDNSLQPFLRYSCSCLSDFL